MKWVLTETRTRVVEADSELEAKSRGVVEEAALWETHDLEAQLLDERESVPWDSPEVIAERRQTAEDSKRKWADRRNWGYSYAKGYRR